MYFVKGGNLDKHIQKKDDVKTQRQGGHLQAKERNLEQIPPSQPLGETKCADALI